jgi:hypothetical protein
MTREEAQCLVGWAATGSCANAGARRVPSRFPFSNVTRQRGNLRFMGLSPIREAQTRCIHNFHNVPEPPPRARLRSSSILALPRRRARPLSSCPSNGVEETAPIPPRRQLRGKRPNLFRPIDLSYLCVSCAGTPHLAVATVCRSPATSSWTSRR